MEEASGPLALRVSWFCDESPNTENLMNEYQERVWRECEEAGEAKVKENLRLGLYSGKHLRYVEAWLAGKAEERARALRERDDVSSTEQISIASSARDAAWEAAAAASRAAIAAERSAEAEQRATDVAERSLKISQAANTRATIALIV